MQRIFSRIGVDVTLRGLFLHHVQIGKLDGTQVDAAIDHTWIAGKIGFGIILVHIGGTRTATRRGLRQCPMGSDGGMVIIRA